MQPTINSTTRHKEGKARFHRSISNNSTNSRSKAKLPKTLSKWIPISFIKRMVIILTKCRLYSTKNNRTKTSSEKVGNW